MILTDYPWYMVLACIALGAAYAAVLYFLGPRRFGTAMRWLLAAVRTLVVGIVALLLLAPVSKRTVHERERPHVVLLQDVSYSVRQGCDSAFSLQALASGLEGSFRVSYLPFGTDGSTDIGSAMERFRSDRVDAMVLASDGIHNRGASPASVAEHLPFKVHCVALGDTTTPRDARLADLRCNRMALLGSRFPVELTVQADQLQGRSTGLSVVDAVGRQVLARRIDFSGNPYSETVAATIEAKSAGLQRFSVRLDAVDGEQLLENNSLTFYVDVIDTRRKVAILANAPHPDVAALRQSIEGNDNYEAVVVMADEAEAGRWKPDDDIQLAILHNLPSKEHPDVSGVQHLPTLAIIGLQTDLPRFNALHSGMEIQARSSKTVEATALHQPGFSLFSLTDDDVRLIESLPPLASPFGQARLSEGVQTLFSARLGNIDSRQPLVAASAQGGLRRAWVWGEGLWRWRLAEYADHESHEVFDRWVAQLLNFTAMQSSRERLQVTAERSYPQGDPVVLHAVVYNESFEVTNQPEVSMRLDRVDDKGRAVQCGEYSFRREGSGYALSLPSLDEGLYRYSARCGDLAAEGSFAVEATNLEQRWLVADHNLLASVAAATGGGVYAPGEVDELVEKLSEIKPTIYTHTRFTELSKVPWVLALLVLLLAVEWAVRKYSGSI